MFQLVLHRLSYFNSSKIIFSLKFLFPPQLFDVLSSKLVYVTRAIASRLLDFEYFTHIILDWVFTFVRVNRIQSWLVDRRRFRMQIDTVNGLLHFDLAIDVGYILWFICHWLNLSIWHLNLLAFINCIL